jgi:hypothetical protein
MEASVAVITTLDDVPGYACNGQPCARRGIQIPYSFPLYPTILTNNRGLSPIILSEIVKELKLNTRQRRVFQAVWSVPYYSLFIINDFLNLAILIPPDLR